MTFDMNDAEPQKTTDLIPDGSFAKITMTIRPGNADGHGEIDQGLLKTSNSPGSDVLMLDAEFTVVEGPLGAWLEGRGRLHQPIHGLKMIELDAMASNAISRFIVLASQRIKEQPEDSGDLRQLLLG
jgi:hypothetical protein